MKLSFSISKACVVALGMALLLATATPARALEPRPFNRDYDNHPLKLVRYVLYPLGALVEYTVFRPAHYIGSRLIPDEQCFHGGLPTCRDQTRSGSYRNRDR